MKNAWTTGHRLAWNVPHACKTYVPGPECASTTCVQPESGPPASRPVFFPRPAGKPKRGGESGRTASSTRSEKLVRSKSKSGESGDRAGPLDGRASEAERGIGRRKQRAVPRGGQLAAAGTPQTGRSEAEGRLSGGLSTSLTDSMPSHQLALICIIFNFVLRGARNKKTHHYN